MDSYSASTRWWLILTIPLFILLAIYFLSLHYTADAIAEKSAPEVLKPEWYRVDTARGEYRENATIVGNCHICHAFWVPIPQSAQTSNPRFAHANLQLNHGGNDRCYNCHQIADRNMYVADDGSAILNQTPEKMCARCHGLIFNDWQAGTHGKWTGKYTPANYFERITYTCTECHDPHDPKFKYNILAPPPVWPKKYIRTVNDGIHAGPLSKILIGEEPKEIF